MENNTYDTMRDLWHEASKILDNVRLTFDARGLRLQAEKNERQIDVHFYSIEAVRGFLKNLSEPESDSEGD